MVRDQNGAGNRGGARFWGHGAERGEMRRGGLRYAGARQGVGETLLLEFPRTKVW